MKYTIISINFMVAFSKWKNIGAVMYDLANSVIGIKRMLFPANPAAYAHLSVFQAVFILASYYLE